jgi:hypothetical protein
VVIQDVSREVADVNDVVAGAQPPRELDQVQPEIAASSLLLHAVIEVETVDQDGGIAHVLPRVYR